MSFARVYSAQTNLLSGQVITVELDISRGLNSFSVVGLADKAVDESKDRVGSALKNSGYESPKSKNQKVVVSLAPADIKKEGPAFDLPIALAYLLSAEEISFDPKEKLFLGELSLDGTLRPITGAVLIALFMVVSLATSMNPFQYSGSFTTSDCRIWHGVGRSSSPA